MGVGKRKNSVAPCGRMDPYTAHRGQDYVCAGKQPKKKAENQGGPPILGGQQVTTGLK